MRATGHAYPWDVLGDPAFASRVLDLGLTEVTLAASYHSVRAATPLHPEHQIIDARHAALYRPITSEWKGRALVPHPPSWVPGEDPFLEAATTLADAGLDVNAWVVLDHNSRLGGENPEFATVNCFGDLYPYALCPSRVEVREYAALLVAEAVRGAPVTGVTVEAWGQLGLAHNSLHEKTAGAFGPEATGLLSFCCCAACREAWTAEGADSAAIVAALRARVRFLQIGEPVDAPEDAILELLRSCRRAAAGMSLDGILAVIAARPEPLQFRAFCGTDPAAGASVGALSPAALDRIDGVIQGAWTPGPAAEESVRRLRAALPDRIAVSAYLTVVPPVHRTAFDAHVAAVAAAGADSVNLYHLGLAGRERLEWMKDLSDA